MKIVKDKKGSVVHEFPYIGQCGEAHEMAESIGGTSEDKPNNVVTYEQGGLIDKRPRTVSRGNGIAIRGNHRTKRPSE